MLRFSDYISQQFKLYLFLKYRLCVFIWPDELSFWDQWLQVFINLDEIGPTFSLNIIYVLSPHSTTITTFSFLDSSVCSTWYGPMDANIMWNFVQSFSSPYLVPCCACAIQLCLQSHCSFLLLCLRCFKLQFWSLYCIKITLSLFIFSFLYS